MLIRDIRRSEYPCRGTGSPIKNSPFQRLGLRLLGFNSAWFLNATFRWVKTHENNLFATIGRVEPLFETDASKTAGLIQRLKNDWYNNFYETPRISVIISFNKLFYSGIGTFRFWRKNEPTVRFSINYSKITAVLE